MVDAFVCSTAFDASVTYWEVMIASKLALSARLTCLQFTISPIICVLVLLDVRHIQTCREEIASLSGVSTICILG